MNPTTSIPTSLPSPGGETSTFARKMNPIREITKTIMKAAIVTVAVVLGFCAGSAFGLPVWLQSVFLVPAMLLFCRLSGQRRPAIWMIVFAGFLSVFGLLVSLGSKHLPEKQFWIYYILVVLITPFGAVLNWLDRRFFPNEHKSEQDFGLKQK